MLKDLVTSFERFAQHKVKFDPAKVRALQKSFKLKRIMLKVIGGGELDAPKLKFSIAGVEDDQVIVKPEIKIGT